MSDHVRALKNPSYGKGDPKWIPFPWLWPLPAVGLILALGAKIQTDDHGIMV
jgi:hypothetical protein